MGKKTAVWADMVADTTTKKTGRKENVIKSTSHKNVHIVLCLSAQANRKKSDPFIIFPRAKVRQKVWTNNFNQNVY